MLQSRLNPLYVNFKKILPKNLFHLQTRKPLKVVPILHQLNPKKTIKKLIKNWIIFQDVRFKFSKKTFSQKIFFPLYKQNYGKKQIKRNFCDKPRKTKIIIILGKVRLISEITLRHNLLKASLSFHWRFIKQKNYYEIRETTKYVKSKHQETCHCFVGETKAFRIGFKV